MNEHIRVELIPRTVPIDPDTRAEREQVVQRLADLGHIDPSTGQIPDLMQDGWLARINGVVFPVADFGVGPIGDSGQAMVSLLVPADSVQVGDPPVSTGRPQMRADAPVKTERSTWGAAAPDPREGIAGWRPETLADQVAGNAEKAATVSFEPAGPSASLLAGLHDRISLRRQLGGTAGALA